MKVNYLYKRILRVTNKLTYWNDSIKYIFKKRGGNLLVKITMKRLIWLKHYFHKKKIKYKNCYQFKLKDHKCAKIIIVRRSFSNIF